MAQMTQSRSMSDWLGPFLFLLLGWLIAAWVISPHRFRSVDPNVSEVQELLALDGAFVPMPLTQRTDSNLELRARVQSAQNDQHAFLLNFAGQPTQLLLNGIELERMSLHAGADEAGLRQSFLYLVPNHQARASALSLELIAEPRAGRVRLGGLFSGPRVELERRYREYRLTRFELTQSVLVAACLIAIFAALIWNARRNELMYGWFAAGVGFWIIYLSHFVWFKAPMQLPVWQCFIHVSLGFALYCMLRFCHLFLRITAGKLEKALLLTHITVSIIALATALISPSSSAQFFTMNVLLRLVLFAFAIHLLVSLIRAALRTHERQVYWLLAATVLGLSYGVYDSVIVLAERNTATLIFHLGIFPLLAVFGFTVILRFSNLLQDANAQNLVLDSRVQEKTAALERIFAARQELERERLLVDERHRLATDLHDGAGSQLVSLLAAVRRDGLSQAQMEQALLEAIADLRLVMDSIDSMGSDLAEALGQFRSRLEPRVHAAGVKSKWRTASLRDGLKLSPRRTLNIFRALQEGIVNVLKHAQASEIEISARDGGSVLELCVRDNGKGLAPELFDPATRAKMGGRGLSNFDSRMKSLGGYAKFSAASDDPNQPGLEIRLYVPIPPENETKW
jgi:signal transduction histidine kinase